MTGRRFTSRINGNSIFFPASGYRYGTGLDSRGSNGLYWSASLGSQTYGYYLNFYSGRVDPAYDNNRVTGSLSGRCSNWSFYPRKACNLFQSCRASNAPTGAARQGRKRLYIKGITRKNTELIWQS